MKEEIEQILAEVRDLKCKTEKDIEDARVRLLGKKGEITKLFEEFRTSGAQEGVRSEAECPEEGSRGQDRGTQGQRGIFRSIIR